MPISAPIMAYSPVHFHSVNEQMANNCKMYAKTFLFIVNQYGGLGNDEKVKRERGRNPLPIRVQT